MSNKSKYEQKVKISRTQHLSGMVRTGQKRDQVGQGDLSGGEEGKK